MNSNALRALLVVVALGFPAVAGVKADEFTKEDLERWKTEYLTVVAKGRAPWTSPELGTNGVACAQCHPNGANTHPETSAKFQLQLGKVATLRDMIHGCIQSPVEGKPLPLDDPKMVAIEADLFQERRGVELEPGKH